MNDTSAQVPLPLPGEALRRFCQRWRIARLELFGSALRGELHPDSDIDFLYTLAPDAPWGWEFTDAELELSELLGRRAELVSRRGLERSANRRRREEILSTARLVYDAG